MTRRLGSTHPAAGWVAVAGLLCAWAMIAGRLDPGSIDWQPSLALHEPWRALTAVGVHYSRLHLAANLAGAVLAGAFGVAADVPPRAAWAWLAAWPLTQFGLWVAPDLTHFGGLSGVLHAGVVIVIVCLLARGTPAQRGIAVLVLIGYAAKLIGEDPAGPALRHPAGWDIATAPLAHATGTLAGAACGVVAMVWPGPPNAVEDAST